LPGRASEKCVPMTPKRPVGLAPLRPTGTQGRIPPSVPTILPAGLVNLSYHRTPSRGEMYHVNVPRGTENPI
jgi:hypothetical protein